MLLLAIVSARLPLLLFSVAVWSACASSTVSRGATLLSGLREYHGEMSSLSGAPARWPERQRAGGQLKNIVTVTVGASAEFYRLVDLDIRKREFEITLRETNVPADRAREMKDELAQLDEEIAALKPVIRTQLAAIRLADDGERGIDEVAARGLISLALDRFSTGGGARSLAAPSTQVGRYSVTDLGSFATVRTPDGQSFRCVVLGVAEQGAAISCEPAGR